MKCGPCYSPRDCRSSPWRWMSTGSVHWRCKEGQAWRPPGPSCRPPGEGSWQRGRPGWRGPARGTRGGVRHCPPGWRELWPRARGVWPGSSEGAGGTRRGPPHCRWETCWSPTLICWGRWLESCSQTEITTRYVQLNSLFAFLYTIWWIVMN